MRVVLEFDTLAVIGDPYTREIVDAYLKGEISGTTAAIKLGWEFSDWQAYMAEAINLAVYLAHQEASNPGTTNRIKASISVTIKE